MIAGQIESLGDCKANQRVRILRKQACLSTGIPEPKTTLIPIPISPARKNNAGKVFARIRRFNVGETVGESDQPLWKELYAQAFMESDRAKVTLLLLAAELAMTERSRQLLNSPEHHEELTELAVAKAALETIRFRKLGWPPVAPS
jgi:hypothetical protein